MLRWSRKTAAGIVICALTALLAAGAVSAKADGEVYKYKAYGRRDPFIPLLGVPERGSGQRGLHGILTVDDVHLQGILVDPGGKREVIINGEIIKEGTKTGQLTVESIGNNLVVIKIGEETHKLRLYE